MLNFGILLSITQKWNYSVKHILIEPQVKKRFNNYCVVYAVEAFWESINRQRTYLLVSSMTVTVCVKSTRAAVGLPVGLKPYWSYKLAGDTFAIIKSRTTSLSTSLDNIGITEIGLRSEGIETGFVLETDVMAVFLQADSTLPIERD